MYYFSNIIVQFAPDLKTFLPLFLIFFKFSDSETVYQGIIQERKCELD